jgi:hypothetical protein
MAQRNDKSDDAAERNPESDEFEACFGRVLENLQKPKINFKDVCDSLEQALLVRLLLSQRHNVVYLYSRKVITAMIESLREIDVRRSGDFLKVARNTLDMLVQQQTVDATPAYIMREVQPREREVKGQDGVIEQLTRECGNLLVSYPSEANREFLVKYAERRKNLMSRDKAALDDLAHLARDLERATFRTLIEKSEAFINSLDNALGAPIGKAAAELRKEYMDVRYMPLDTKFCDAIRDAMDPNKVNALVAKQAGITARRELFLRLLKLFEDSHEASGSRMTSDENATFAAIMKSDIDAARTQDLQARESEWTHTILSKTYGQQ